MKLPGEGDRFPFARQLFCVKWWDMDSAVRWLWSVTGRKKGYILALIRAFGDPICCPAVTINKTL